MNEAINQVVNFTNNYRAVCSSVKKGEMKISIVNNEVILEVPSTLDLSMYRKGSFLYLLGQEIVSQAIYGIDEMKTSNNFHSWQGIKAVNVYNFFGSFANGGFHEIKEVIGNKITLNTNKEFMTEEDFNGIMFLTAWTQNKAQLSKIKDWINTPAFLQNVKQERVKNYSYTLGGNDTIDKTTGIPKSLIYQFKSYKKLPEYKFQELKRVIYVC